MKLKILAFTLAYCFIGTVQCNRTSYIGGDFIYSVMGFKKDFGNHISPRSAPGLNIFAGHMLTNNFGFEVGQECYKTKRKTALLETNQFIYGFYFDDPTKWYNTISQKSRYLVLVAQKKIFNSTFIATHIGFSAHKIKVTSELFETNLPLIPTYMLYFKKTKTVPTIKLLLTHNLNNNLTLRVFTCWKNTGRIKVPLHHATLRNTSYKLKLNNSIVSGLGLSWFFM